MPPKFEEGLILVALATIVGALVYYVTRKPNQVRSLSFTLYWMKITSKRYGQGTLVGHLQSIHVYPVKSCRGIELKASLIEERGLLYDRLWMIVNSSGTFRTQRQIPKMGQIQPNMPSSFTEVRI